MESTNLSQNQKLSNHILLGWEQSTKCEHKNCQTPQPNLYENKDKHALSLQTFL